MKAARDLRHARGRACEAAASAYLINAGLQPIAANVSVRLGELDLVMLDRDADGHIVVFVEVRYRRAAHFGGGAVSVDMRKQQKIICAAQLFLARHSQYQILPCRFDVIAASGNPARPTLDWIRDAFRVED